MIVFCSHCGTEFESRLGTKFCSGGCRQNQRNLSILRAQIKNQGYNGFRVSQLRRAGYTVTIREKKHVS